MKGDSRRLRLLLLEDDPLDAELIQSTLAGGGIPCETTVVETREDFTAACEGGPLDLILADYALPAFDGLSALRIARETRPRTPFIFVSGAVGEERAIESLKRGATDYVLKQRLERLVPVVRRAVEEVEARVERERAEEALRRSLKEFANLKYALDESAIVVMADVEGEISYVNDRYCEISGCSREEFSSEEHRIVDPAYHPATIVDDVWRTLLRREVWRGELKYPAQDGTHFWLDASIVPFLDEEGEPYRYVAICNDITQRKRGEETLRRLLEELANLKFARHDEERADRGRLKTEG